MAKNTLMEPLVYKKELEKYFTSPESETRNDLCKNKYEAYHTLILSSSNIVLISRKQLSNQD